MEKHRTYLQMRYSTAVVVQAGSCHRHGCLHQKTQQSDLCWSHHQSRPRGYRRVRCLGARTCSYLFGVSNTAFLGTGEDTDLRTCISLAGRRYKQPCRWSKRGQRSRVESCHGVSMGEAVVWCYIRKNSRSVNGRNVKRRLGREASEREEDLASSSQRVLIGSQCARGSERRST